MQVIDIIILILVLAGAIVGFRKGFIKQLASLVGLVVGLLAAKALYGVVGDQLSAHSIYLSGVVAYQSIGDYLSGMD